MDAWELLARDLDIPSLFLARPSWYDQAACRGMDVSLFFPDHGVRSRTARATCATCPVAGECLDMALDGLDYGIWGNTSDRERQTLRRTRKAS